MPGIRHAHLSTTELVAAALDGDRHAWAAIVNRHKNLVWKAVNMVTSNHDDREEAFARTWLRLATSLRTVREPERLPGWLAMTARREAIAVSKERSVVILLGDDEALAASARPDGSRHSDDDRPDQALLAAETAAAVRAAFQQLDAGCQQLLTLLILQDPPLSYAEIERQLGRSHGWIGPTRGRCLKALRNQLALLAQSDQSSYERAVG